MPLLVSGVELGLLVLLLGVADSLQGAGALQGLDKAETAAKFGEQQVRMVLDDAARVQHGEETDDE